MWFKHYLVTTFWGFSVLKCKVLWETVLLGCRFQLCVLYFVSCFLTNAIGLRTCERTTVNNKVQKNTKSMSETSRMLNAQTHHTGTHTKVNSPDTHTMALKERELKAESALKINVKRRQHSLTQPQTHTLSKRLEWKCRCNCNRGILFVRSPARICELCSSVYGRVCVSMSAIIAFISCCFIFGFLHLFIVFFFVRFRSSLLSGAHVQIHTYVRTFEIFSHSGTKGSIINRKECHNLQ